MNVWLQFFLCAGAILYAGSKLTHIADDISERTGLGRSWIGLILLATITSLPELITGISAVRLNDLPDINWIAFRPRPTVQSHYHSLWALTNMIADSANLERVG
jgi:hypothetical protein